MIKSNIKIIIFDFDGTIHTGEKWINWLEYMRNVLKNTLPQYNEKQIKDFLEKYNLAYNCNTSDLAYALIQEFGTAQNMLEYLSKNIYILDYPNLKVISTAFLDELTKKHTLYIVSNSPAEWIERHLKNWKIDKKYFKNIYFNQFNAKNPTKSFIYEEIIKNEKVLPEEVLVIGDNIKDDLLPAQKLNMQTLHTTQINDIYSYFGYTEKN